MEWRFTCKAQLLTFDTIKVYHANGFSASPENHTANIGESAHKTFRPSISFSFRNFSENNARSQEVFIRYGLYAYDIYVSIYVKYREGLSYGKLCLE